MLVRIHNTNIEAPVAESWLSRHNLIVPEWSKRPDLWREAFALVRRVPGLCAVSHPSRLSTVQSLVAKRSAHGCRRLVFGSLARQESTSHTFDSISACSIQVHSSLNSFSISMKRRREDRRTLVGRGGTLEISPGWGGFLQQQAGRRLSVDFEGMHARVEATLASALRRDLTMVEP